MRTTELDVLLEIAQQLKVSLYDTADFQCGNIFLKLLTELVNKTPLFVAGEQHKLRFYKQAIVEVNFLLSPFLVTLTSLALDRATVVQGREGRVVAVETVE